MALYAAFLSTPCSSCTRRLQNSEISISEWVARMTIGVRSKRLSIRSRTFSRNAASPAPIPSSISRIAARHVKMHARLLLQIPDYAEKVLGLRVAARTEHADQALRRRASCCPELFKADGRLDVVA